MVCPWLEPFALLIRLCSKVVLWTKKCGDGEVPFRQFLSSNTSLVVIVGTDLLSKIQSD